MPIVFQSLTELIAQQLCEKVLREEDRTALEITYGDNSKLPFYKQFYCYFKDRLLRYSIEETEMMMAMICSHAMQDIYKFKLLQRKIEELNNPEGFASTHLGQNKEYVTGGNMESEEMSGVRSDKALLISRTDSLSSELSESLNRGGASALNEDFQEIESDWFKRDKPLEQNKSISIADINLPEMSSLVDLENLKVSLTTKGSPIRATENGNGESEAPKVSYTDITVGKSVAGGTNEGIISGKNFNNAKVAVTVNKSSSFTSMNNKNTNSAKIDFIVNDNTYRALHQYSANFRESFLSSFSSLFVNQWAGY